MYDLLIRNAYILDGTGNPGCHGDVGVLAGKIAAVAPRVEGEAKVLVDARGLALAPGFIDSHSHNDALVEQFPECIAAVEQGITTQVAGMCGLSAAPLSPEHTEDGLRGLRTLCEHPLSSPVENRYSFARYLDIVDRPLGSSMAFLVGHGMLRAAVMGYADRVPTKSELESMEALLDEALGAGAFGLSFGLIYPPGSYCDEEEMTALCRVVAARGGVMTVHLRSENTRLIEATEEMLRVVRRSGVRCVISHHKATGGPANWGKTEQTLALIHQANDDGFDVFCDQYPYTASSTSLATNIPGKMHALGTEKLLEMLGSPAGRAALRPLILEGKTPEERFVYTMIGHSPSHPEYNGRMLNDLARGSGQDPYELQCDILLADRLTTGAIFHTMSEDDVCRVMRDPRAMIGTDGIWYPGSEGTHPRSIGTFPRVLGRYVRAQGIIPLEQAIRKMTSLPAMVYGLHGKGLLRAGMDADMVLFDADKIIDHADYTDFRARCEGLTAVYVGGGLAAENAVFTGLRGGKVLRRS